MSNKKISNSTISGGFGGSGIRHMREYMLEEICLATGMVCYNAVFVYSTSAAAGLVEETLTADKTGCNIKSYRHTTLTRFSSTKSQSRNSI